MSVVTVFLTVSLITFLDMMTKLSPILTLQYATAMSGDLDIYISGNYGDVKKI